jgi:two-component system CheB/CheR fusion protein
VHYLLRIAPYHGSNANIEGAVVTFIDVTTLRRAEAHQQVLIAELNHRVKNMLMVVIGVAEQTYRTSNNAKGFKDRFVERVHAMARSHELLSRQNWEKVALSDIVALHFAPFGAERGRVDGPPVSLNPKQALGLGMIVHELATNASKYGALSTPNGSVDVTWTEAEPGLELIWRESNGPATAPPSRHGFGLKLVERETRASLGGKASIDFDPAGLRVRLTFHRQ